MTRVLCSGSFICDFIAADLPGMGNPGDLIYPPGGIRLHPGTEIPRWSEASGKTSWVTT